MTDNTALGRTAASARLLQQRVDVLANIVKSGHHARIQTRAFEALSLVKHNAYLFYDDANQYRRLDRPRISRTILHSIINIILRPR